MLEPSIVPVAPRANDVRLKPDAGGVSHLQPIQKEYSNSYFSILNRGGYFTLESDCHDVVIVPIVEDREVVMVRPFRPILNDAPLEFPGGGGEGMESPLESAAREFAEETGLSIGDLDRFNQRPPFCLSPNRMPKLHHVFEIRITEEEAARMKPDGKEIFSIERFTFEEAEALIATGTIYVAAVAGILASWLFSRKVLLKKVVT